MPVVGGEFHGFTLLAELGRGGLARVFLAQENALANRHVVLKVAPALWGEAETLGQLHHVNIVPVLSVHEHEPFQAVCMPYLGWTTLQDVLHEIRGHTALPTSGRASSARSKQAPVAASQPADAELVPGAAFVDSVSSQSYVEAVVSLAEKLAAGLCARSTSTASFITI